MTGRMQDRLDAGQDVCRLIILEKFKFAKIDIFLVKKTFILINEISHAKKRHILSHIRKGSNEKL